MSGSAAFLRSTRVVKAKQVRGIRCEAPAAINARQVIRTRLDEMLSFAPWVDDPANVEEIHNLRIAAKRLRYSLELFRFALPSAAGGMIDEVKEIQEHVGNLHDADVMIERVLEVIASDGRRRASRLLNIAASIDRGTIAQRHQRIRAAAMAPSGARDDVALFTLVAHQADDRDRAYASFIDAWHRLLTTDFPGRLERLLNDAVERSTLGSGIVDGAAE